MDYCRAFSHAVYSLPMKLLAGAAAFVGGAVIAPVFGSVVPLSALCMFACAAMLGAVLLRLRSKSPWPALIALAGILGVARVVAIADAPPPMLASASPQQIEGVVLSDVEGLGSFTRFQMRLERVKAGGSAWAPTEATLLVTVRANSEITRLRDAPYFRYGDRLLVEGIISEPPELEGFDYAAYLARQGVAEVLEARSVELIDESEGSAFYGTLYGFRWRLASSIAAVVPEPQAALAQAALLGLRRNIPAELTDAFRRTGTAHLLAISGMHVGILLAVSLSASAAVLGRKHHLHLIAPLLVIWTYGLLSGLSPSATRACIMGSVYLASLAFGRQRGALAPIGLAAAMMVAVSPSVVYSISFQLSFAAIAGIAAFTDMFGNALTTAPRRRAAWRSAFGNALVAVRGMIGVSLAATIATLPLIAFHFERISTLGIPASVLTLPALPFLIVSSAGTALAGLASATMAAPFGWLAWGAGEYITGVVTLLAKLPGAAPAVGNIPATAIVAFYGTLVLAYVGWVTFPGRVRDLLRKAAAMWNPAGSTSSSSTRQHTEGGRWSARIAIWLLVPAAFVASLAWSQALTKEGQLHVVFFDVGQGDAVFIETPGGRQVVVDGGADPLLVTRLLGDRMAFYDRRLDIVVASHPNSDHIGGLLQVLERFDVGAVMERRTGYESATYEAWRRAVDAVGVAVIDATEGQVIALDEGVRLEVLGPPRELLRGTESDADNASLVLRLVYGEVSFLLTGDIFAAAERALLARGAAVDSDVLKVPHHGSDTSSTAEFLAAVSPAVAVVSVGADNRFGHPDADVVGRLREHVGEKGLFVTAERGTVEFTSDGEALWVSTER